MSDLARDKRALRAWAKAKRAEALKPADWTDAGRLFAVLENEPAIRRAVFADDAIIGGYAAMPGECDPGPLLAALSLSRCRTALPVMQGKTEPLAFRAWKPGDPMRRAIWGIEEPLESAEVVAPTVLLVPLLAVDRAGHRLGYGAGYYDRTIRHLRTLQPLVTIGITLSVLILDAVPHSDYDEPIDWVLTPERLMKCQRPS